MSKFALVCGAVALLYFVYRISLVGLSVATVNTTMHHTKNANIVCTSDDKHRMADPRSLVSESYQKSIRERSALSANLVQNADLMKTDSELSYPVGFSRSIESPTAAYQYLEDKDKSRFLRVLDSREGAPLNNTRPAWLIPLVDIKPELTYAYTFQYRSGVPVEIALESTGANGVASYQLKTILPATSSWRTFTAHYSNLNQAKAFRPIITTTKPGYVDVKGFDVHQVNDSRLTEGMVSVTFDDGWQSITGATKLLEQRGIRTTQYIISEVADNKVPEYMTFDTLRTLKKAGHEIGSHSLRHCDQTTLSPQVLEDNATKSKQILEDNKFGPVRSFAYPHGQYNEQTQAVYEPKFTYIRTSDAGYNDRYFDTANIHSMGVLSTTSDEQFKQWLDYAKVHRQWLVVVYHRVNESGKYNVTLSQLERQLNLIKASKLRVLPLEEAADTAKQ